jgi:hypothetical protein
VSVRARVVVCVWVGPPRCGRMQRASARESRPAGWFPASIDRMFGLLALLFALAQGLSGARDLPWDLMWGSRAGWGARSNGFRHDCVGVCAMQLQHEVRALLLGLHALLTRRLRARSSLRERRRLRHAHGRNKPLSVCRRLGSASSRDCTQLPCIHTRAHACTHTLHFRSASSRVEPDGTCRLTLSSASCVRSMLQSSPIACSFSNASWYFRRAWLAAASDAWHLRCSIWRSSSTCTIWFLPRA